MVICKVLGGLGNQMFCYAFARNLQLICNDTLFLNTEVYKWDNLRDYSLNVLNIPDDIKQNRDVQISSLSKIYFNKTQQLYNTIIYKPKKNIFNTDIIGKNVYHFLNIFGLYYNLDRYYYPVSFHKKGLKYTYGYFQSENYFKEHKTQIKKELKVCIEPTLKEKEILQTITSTNSIGVSIRSGTDYLNSNLNICNQNYYYNAMEVIANKVDNPVFFIFSDCIDLVKQTFSFKYPVHFIKNFKVYESLRLLYSCKHFVIANSSFSWWGSYLSDYEKKIVVAPNKWHLNSTKKPDIYLDDMILIEV